MEYNEKFILNAVELSDKYYLKTLDLIQLTAGILSRQNVFITSDENLGKVARKEIEKVIVL